MVKKFRPLVGEEFDGLEEEEQPGRIRHALLKVAAVLSAILLGVVSNATYDQLKALPVGWLNHKHHVVIHVTEHKE